MTEKKTDYGSLPSTARHVNFRMPPEVVEKLVAAGIVPAEFDRKTLSSSILDFFKEYTAKKVPTIEPDQTMDVVKTLKSIENRLEQLEGKLPPQAA